MNDLATEVNEVMGIFSSAMDAVAASMKEYTCNYCGIKQIYTDIFPTVCYSCHVGEWEVVKE